MAYSNITQLRFNVPRITVTVMGDVAVTDRIDIADDKVEVDLGNLVDFTLVVDTPAGCPDYINKLSQYKTAEKCLVARFSAKRMAEEITDWQYWQSEYNILLEKILSGMIDLGAVALAGATYSKRFREDIEPALGQGERGEWANDDDIEDIRSDYGNQD